jgi:5-methyltetrahydrofolate--homocysteine methyltransferase
VLNGTDPDCMNWIRTYKDYQPHAAGAPAPAAAAPAGRAGGRRGGREARLARG